MATTLSRNLKLRINSSLTADAKYNLERLDLLGATFLVDSANNLQVRSQADIVIEPESADVGGSASGGTVTIGTVSHEITSLAIYASDISFSSPLSLLDQGTGGTRYLDLRYKSDLSGSTDTVADRILSVDLQGADRSVILGGNLTTVAGDLTLTTTGTTDVTLPLTGTLATLAGSEVLTNKSIDAASNTLTNITNTSISASAGIVYSKLSLGNSIVNADVSSSAAVAYSKLNLAGSIVNADISTGAAIARSKIATGNASHVLINDVTGALSSEATLSKARGGTGADMSAVTFPGSGTLATLAGTETLTNKTISGSANTLLNIDYSSLVLTNSVVNADISSSAAIAYSKLNLVGSVGNADISAAAGIARSKLAQGTVDHVVINSGTGAFSSEANLAIVRGGTGAGTANDALNNLLPDQSSATGKVLQSDGTNASWESIAGTGTVTSVDLVMPSAVFDVSGGPVTAAGTFTVTLDTQSANRVWAGPTNGAAATPTFRALVIADLPAAIPYSSLDLADSIVDADIDSAAAISLSKLAALTIDRALVSDGSGVVSASAVTSTELGYISGVTSALQGQMDGKQPLDADLTAIAALASNGLVTRTGAGTATVRTITAGTGISVADGDGVLGNPTISSTITQYTDELAQDAVGGIFADTATIALVYTDGTPEITADVIPGGVDHDALLNFVGNEHVDHTAVSITTAANSGLSGGGTIAATRSLVLDPTNAPTVAPAAADVILFADASSANALSKTTLQDILDLGGGKFTDTWVNADGASFVATHNFATTDVTVTVYDIDSGEDLLVDSVVRTDANTVTLTASSAPDGGGSGWRVVIRK